MVKSNLESKIQKNHHDPYPLLPKTTKIVNNIIDIWGVGIVYGAAITYLTIKAIQVIPEKTCELYNNLTSLYQTIEPFIENIFNS
jgi:hypothetical protein